MEQLPPVWNLIQACVQTKGPSLPSLREQLSQHEKRYHELENNVYQSNLNFTPSFQAPHESLSPVPPASPSASQLSTPPPVYSSVPRNLLSSTPQSSQATLYAQVQPSFGGPSYRLMAPSQAKLLTPPVVPSSISTYRPSAPPPPPPPQQYQMAHHPFVFEHSVLGHHRPLAPPVTHPSHLAPSLSPLHNQTLSPPKTPEPIPSLAASSLSTITPKFPKTVVDPIIRCYMCKIDFTRTNDLQRHQRSRHPSTVDKQNAPSCTKCGKKFCRPDSLKRHMRVYCHEPNVVNC